MDSFIVFVKQINTYPRVATSWIHDYFLNFLHNYSIHKMFAILWKYTRIAYALHIDILSKDFTSFLYFFFLSFYIFCMKMPNIINQFIMMLQTLEYNYIKFGFWGGGGLWTKLCLKTNSFIWNSLYPTL